MSDPGATVICMDDRQLTGAPAGMRLDPCCSLAQRFVEVSEASSILNSIGIDCVQGMYRRPRLLRTASGGTALSMHPAPRRRSSRARIIKYD
jgi:hypothetical protein